MAAFFVAADSIQCVEGGNEDFGLDLSVPASAIIGDVVVALWTAQNNLRLGTTPSGWTQIGASSDDAALYYLKIASLADVKSYAWNAVGNITNSFASVTYGIYRGADRDDPIDGYAVSAGNAITNTYFDCPSASATEAGSTLVCLGSCKRAENAVPPSGMTERYDEAATGPLRYLMDAVVTVTGAQGAQRIDIASTAQYWGAGSVILNAGAGGSRVTFIGV